MDHVQIRKVATFIVGVVVFVGVLYLLQATNVLAFAVDVGVQQGNVSATFAPQATSFSEIGLGAVSVVLFMFSRFGAACTAFVQVLIFGVVNRTPPAAAPPVSAAPAAQASAVAPAAAEPAQFNPQAEIARQRRLMAQLFDAASRADKKALFDTACEIRGERWITASAARVKKGVAS